MRLPTTMLALTFAAACAGGGVASDDAKPGAASGDPTDAGCTFEDLSFSRDDAAEIVAGLSAEFAGAGGIDAWAEENGRKPRVRFHGNRNRTPERIDLKPMTADLQAAMAATGNVELLAEFGAELAAVHEEQDAGAPMGYESGADLVGSMEILSTDDATATGLFRFYKAYVTLTAAETLSKVWIGEHEIQKMCELPTPAE